MVKTQHPKYLITPPLYFYAQLKHPREAHHLMQNYPLYSMVSPRVLKWYRWLGAGFSGTRCFCGKMRGQASGTALHSIVKYSIKNHSSGVLLCILSSLINWRRRVFTHFRAKSKNNWYNITIKSAVRAILMQDMIRHEKQQKMMGWQHIDLLWKIFLYPVEERMPFGS